MDEQMPLSADPFDDAEFADNPEQRCACVLLLDTSGSMSGEAINQLNGGLAALGRDLADDPLAAKRVELALVTFGPVELVADFCPVEAFRPPVLVAEGDTPIGGAVERGLAMIEARKLRYREAGVPYYRPWILLVTDGVPTDRWARAARAVAEVERRRGGAFFAVGVEGADMDMLGELSVRTPLRLRGLAFGSLLRWLSTSLSAVSRSTPGGALALPDPTAPGGWASVD